MDYVLWEDDRDEGEAFIYGGWPQSVKISFLSGTPIREPVPPIDITMNEKSQGILTDNLMVAGGPHIFSERLLRVLREQGVDNVDTYACTVRNSITGEIRDDFAIANIIGKISCVNRSESSVVSASGDPGQLVAFNYLTLNEQVIRDVPLFLLAEMPVQIVLHRRIATALERAGISGVCFVEQGNPQSKLPPIQGAKGR